MSELAKLFESNGYSLRVEGTADQPLFCAADICRMLEIVNVSDAISKLPEKERCIASTDTSIGVNDLLFVTEPGLYQLIFSSRKKEAATFRDWVFSEVLPSIRKTGSYSVPQPAETKPVMTATEKAEIWARFDAQFNFSTNPRLQQGYQDLVLNELGYSQPQLPGDSTVLKGVAEWAVELGYPLSLVTNTRSSLGKFTKKSHLPLKEQRLVNGQIRPVNVYPLSESLRETINTFFDRMG